MPMLTDIAFDSERNMAVGLRDRLGDITLTIGHYAHPTSWDDPVGLGIGDVVRGVPDSDGWLFNNDSEFYRDNIKDASESAFGGLASFPQFDLMIGTALDLAASGIVPHAVRTSTAPGRLFASELAELAGSLAIGHGMTTAVSSRSG
jgi:hypothetical protein